MAFSLFSGSASNAIRTKAMAELRGRHLWKSGLDSFVCSLSEMVGEELERVDDNHLYDEVGAGT